MGGWIALGAVILLGHRHGRYNKQGQPMSAHPPSSIPFLAIGAWILAVGWFGFNVMSAQKIGGISGLVAINSLMAMVGGIIAALFVGSVAGALFVWAFTLAQNKLKVDDVLGVWPLHGLCGAWGGIAAGGFVVYGILKATLGLRLTQEEEYNGADLSIHKIKANPDN